MLKWAVPMIQNMEALGAFMSIHNTQTSFQGSLSKLKFLFRAFFIDFFSRIELYGPTTKACHISWSLEAAIASHCPLQITNYT